MAGRTRLMKEMQEIRREAARGREEKDVKLQPDENDIYSWKARIKGPVDTPYCGGIFTIAFRIPAQYPLVPPEVRFATPFFHPNVHFKSGEICLDILKTAWSPAWTLQSVVALMNHSEPDSPLNCDAANLLRAGDVRGFNSMARMYTKMHASSRVRWEDLRGAAMAFFSLGGAHPSVNLLHAATKVAPALVYILCELVNPGDDAFSVNFVIIVTLLGVDWWVTKNVSGRLLVGLRWWNDTDEEGNTKWMFESLNPDAGERAVDAKDSFVFWTALYTAALAWAVFSFIALIKFSLDYLLICTIAVTLVVTNIVGYVRCSKDARMKLSSFAEQATKTAVSTGMGNFFHIG